PRGVVRESRRFPDARNEREQRRAYRVSPPFCCLTPRRSSGERTEERLPRILCAQGAPEPPPSPSQEGSNTGWPVPLLGGVRPACRASPFCGAGRGGLAGSRFMGRGLLTQSPRSEEHTSELQSRVE